MDGESREHGAPLGPTDIERPPVPVVEQDRTQQKNLRLHFPHRSLRLGLSARGPRAVPLACDVSQVSVLELETGPKSSISTAGQAAGAPPTTT
ncbi:hypothetical protein KNE206_57180 [Kitasatospora sp. NE20-6]